MARTDDEDHEVVSHPGIRKYENIFATEDFFMVKLVKDGHVYLANLIRKKFVSGIGIGTLRRNKIGWSFQKFRY